MQRGDRTAGRRLLGAPWYPFLLAIAFVLVALTESGVSAALAVRPLLVLLAAILVVLVTLRVVAGEWGRAAMGTTALLLVIRSGSALHAFVAVGLLLLVWIAVRVAGRARRRAITSSDFTRGANGLSALLVAIALVGGASNGTLGRVPHDLRLGHVPEARAGIGGSDALPNVYFLLLDGYPRADTLARLFDFDNEPFLEDLRSRGFDISSRSRSNYMYTALTLASMLHGRHVLDLDPAASPGSLRALINDNPTFDTLRSRGYTLFSTASPWDGVALTAVDRRCGEGPMTEFEFHLLRSSLLMGALLAVEPDALAERHRTFTANAFACAAMASASPGPRFVMAHIGAPHLPIVFAADGSAADLRHYSDTAQELDIPPDEFAAAYTGQVRHVNAQTIATIDDIHRNDPDAVIVVASDHGSESRLAWHDASQSDLDERFATLFAARTPGQPDLFGDAPTMVNVMTRVLNAYLGTERPEASDTLYLSDPGILLNLRPLDRDAAQ